MEPLYGNEDQQATGGQSSLSTSDTDWSESYAVDRISADREEVQDLLAPLRNDPRMNFFMQDYDIMYQELVVSNRHRFALRIKQRDQRAKTEVSRAKSKAVEDLYKASDDHIANLRREMNVIYHQLIEMQEAEDASRKAVAKLNSGIASLNANIDERLKDVTPEQKRLKDKAEKKHNQMKAERDRMVAEVDRLKEQYADTTVRHNQLETGRLRVEKKIEATRQDYVRVANDIKTETEKRSKMRAALHTAMQLYEERCKDMDDTRKRLEQSKKQCTAFAEDSRNSYVILEHYLQQVQTVNGQIRRKKYEYDAQNHRVKELEGEITHRSEEMKKKAQEIAVLKEQSAKVDAIRRDIRKRIKELEGKKSHVMRLRDKDKQKNQALLEEMASVKRKNEEFAKEITHFLKTRDFLRRNQMKAKGMMEKDRVMVTLHSLSNKRLQHDNQTLMVQCSDQNANITKLENERDMYFAQTLVTTRKLLHTTDRDKRAMDRVFTVMQKIAQEEMKTLETQHLFESTRNEHALYTRHILHLKDLINTLKNKSLTMTYETQKLVQERDYRDNCLIKGEIAQQKLNRQIFVLKVNLKDLKESNARLKMIIENQDLEEKKLVKMVRVMKAEKLREFKGLERVVMDIEGLDLALTRRHHELHELYRTVKLKQSVLDKGVNTYRLVWKKHVRVTAELHHSRTMTRVTRKNRTVVDKLLTCVTMLQEEKERIHLRSKGLTEELGHPRNIHRWRNLRARDPEAYKSIRNLHNLRRQIQEKVDATSATTENIQQLDRELVSLTASVLAQPSPETILQLKLYHQDLQHRYTCIKKLTAELKEAMESKSDAQAREATIRRKLQEIRPAWFKQMHLEKKGARQRTLQEAGPLSLLPGPEGVAPSLATALMAAATATSSTPVVPPHTQRSPSLASVATSGLPPQGSTASSSATTSVPSARRS